MLSPGTSARVYLAVGATDTRKSIDGLAATLGEQIARAMAEGSLQGIPPFRAVEERALGMRMHECVPG